MISKMQAVAPLAAGRGRVIDMNEKSMKVKLEVPGGGLVGTFGIPPFAKLPEVIVWGSRIFVLHEPRDGRPLAEVAPVYREGLAYVIPSGQLEVDVGPTNPPVIE